MSATDPTRWSLTEAAIAIRNGTVSSLYVTKACLNLIETWQPHINCFIEVESKAAREAANRADAALVKGQILGPLHGVPVAYKDLFRREGRTLTAGSRILGQQVSPDTATIVARLEKAGAVPLGALNLAELAAYTTGENIHWGDCRNPWNPDHIPGGSSSGSAAAVAGRLAYGTLSSDTGGSGRHPAAFCGVVGLKTTHGRVSRHGAYPRAWSLDTMGVMARTAADCAVLLGAIAGHDPNDPTSSRLPVPDYEWTLHFPVSGMRIGAPGGYYRNDLSPAAADALERSRSVLADAGLNVTPVEVPDPGPYSDLADAIMKCEAATIHGRRIRERPEDFSAPVISRNETGLHLLAPRYISALAMRGRLLEKFVATAFAEADVLHLPAVGFPAPSFEEVRRGGPGGVPDVVRRIARFHRPFNYLGLPAVVVPCGFSEDGLPLAFQLVGRPFSEARLLAIAHAYQARTDWHKRAPALAEESAPEG